MVILFPIITSILWLLSKLPLSVLYVISDLLSFFLNRIMGYRKEVIRTNLKNSFPEKSDSEITALSNKYYRNLSDIIIEVIKLRSISKENIIKRFSYENYHLFQEAFDSGQSVIAAIGHCGNWEWLSVNFGVIMDQPGFAIVKPLSDKRFDHYLNKLRTRLNPDSTIVAKDTFRTLVKHKRQFVAGYGFAADQTPTKDEINYWGEFLNQETGFFLGVEKIAKALDFTVVYIDLQREKRGYYKGVISLITDDPKSTKEYEIVESYIRKLEATIKKNPDSWLWSHRRWKHEKSDSQNQN